MPFWEEVKRRKVVRVAVAYAVVAWLLVEIVVTVRGTPESSGLDGHLCHCPGCNRISLGAYAELGLRPDPFRD